MPPLFPLPRRNATENFFVENSAADSPGRFPPSWEPGTGSAASAPPRLTVWSPEGGVREAASERESKPPPHPPPLSRCPRRRCGRNVRFVSRARRSRRIPALMPHAPTSCRIAGWRMRRRSCDVGKRPSHGSGPAACWAQLHSEMRACRACRSRRITPSWAVSPRGRFAQMVTVV